ncbi:hypothetical protein IPC3_21795 [Pseudomonas aeruginosa]|nr:hypothetical protein IPC3_21795 [Pseudomonas aeruginosa]WBJ86593.1 hypothetical protein PALA54_06473 [Pseudomonas aeruginosa]WBJ92840.1 hypothetical protein PALA38_06281 [Pseudomonas aeruginosa]CAI9824196.1 DUF4378 domain-containing protein [Pseudomonas aeruginosa]CAI9865366.1 DUF4378 domain-containing protein [Pseudomonas aeruginosa]
MINWSSSWRPWTELNMWTNDGLIGKTAAQLLDLAKKWNEPVAPTTGGPSNHPIPFSFTANVEDLEVEQICRRVAILWRALDQHIFWRTQVLVKCEVEGSADWQGFVADATKVLEQFMASEPFLKVSTKH